MEPSFRYPRLLYRSALGLILLAVPLPGQSNFKNYRKFIFKIKSSRQGISTHSGVCIYEFLSKMYQLFEGGLEKPFGIIWSLFFFFLIGVGTAYVLIAESILVWYSSLLFAVCHQLEIPSENRSISTWSFQRSGCLHLPLLPTAGTVSNTFKMDGMTELN